MPLIINVTDFYDLVSGLATSAVVGSVLFGGCAQDLPTVNVICVTHGHASE